MIAGGNLRFPNRKLKIKAIPENLPDFINADISELTIGDKLYVTELQNDEFTIMHPENTVVVQVRLSRLSVSSGVEDEDEDEEGEGEAAEGEAAEGAAPAAEGTPAAE